MATPTFTPVRPNQANGAGAVDALTIEEFNGIVETELRAKSLMESRMTVQTATGTNEITKKGLGGGSLVAVTPGVTPDGTSAEFAKIKVKIEKHLLYRKIVASLEDFQTDFSVRSELAKDGGLTHAKFFDQACYIQAIKAAQLTTSPYGIDVFHGGSVKQLATPADASDPAALYQAITELGAMMQGKDVDLAGEGGILVVNPLEFSILAQNELIVNGNYVTSSGVESEGMVIKTLGVPVISTTNLVNTNITDHLLGSQYNGDYSKVKALLFSPKRALFAGQSIAVRSNTWYEDKDLAHYIDVERAFGVTPDRAEYAGIVTVA